LNFVWGTKDVQNHINYEILGSISGISEYSYFVGCDAVSRRFETPRTSKLEAVPFSETAGTIQITTQPYILEDRVVNVDVFSVFYFHSYVFLSLVSSNV